MSNEDDSRGTSFIHQINRSVGQTSRRKVTVRQRRRGNQGAVVYPHTVMHLVLVAYTSQNADRLGHRGLVDKDLREPPLERGIGFDVFPVLR
jgi:hypothetical protein